MTKHLSIRMAWHDNKWNGTICHNPTNNVYCRGNYSLLSSRIQRRINLDLVNQNKDPIAQAIFLMACISWAQPFSGANKRTAYVCADTLLKMNRHKFPINSKNEKEYLIGLLNEIQTNRAELDNIILIKISIFVLKRVKKI